MAGQNALAESGCVTLYLLFNSFGHIHFGAVWYMAICPAGMFACRCTGRIKQTLLRQQNKGLAWIPAIPDFLFCRCNFFQAVSQMYRTRLTTGRICKRNLSVKLPIHLENTHSITIAFQLPFVNGRKTVPG